MKKNLKYEIDFSTNTILVSKSFLKAANQIDTPEFNQMMKLRELNMPITARKIRRKSDKRWS